MSLSRFHQAIVLGAALLLAATAAHARKDDDEQDSRKGRAQSSEQYRGADNGRSRSQRDDRRAPVQDTRRYEQSGSRGGSYYTEPRRGYDTRHYDAIPRRDENADDSRSRGYYEAQPRYENESRYAPRGLSMSEAVSEAQRRSGGRILSAEPGDDGGQPYYRVKVLNPDGRVQILYIDAR